MNKKNSLNLSRIVLGTAQFGMNYGISGSNKVPFEEVRKILNFAKRHQLNTLDTAMGYGDCEQILGQVGGQDWRVVTKLLALPENEENIAQWLLNSVEVSMDRLKTPQIHGLLLHRPSDLLGKFGPALYQSLQTCKERGYVRNIGLSIYNPSELDSILFRYPMDLIQAPFNVLDRRLETSGWLDRLHDSGVEVFVRSVFLQGLLLMSPDQRPEQFGRWGVLWNEWDKWLEDHRASALGACLRCVLNRPKIKHVIVGVDSLAQLQGVLSNLDEEGSMPPSSFDTEDPELLNPSRWNIL